MDIRLPDGTIIKNIPDGISKADLTAKLKANGYDVSKLESTNIAPQNPTSEINKPVEDQGIFSKGGFFGTIGAPIEAVTQGITKGLGDIMYGGQNLIGMGLEKTGDIFAPNQTLSGLVTGQRPTNFIQSAGKALQEDAARRQALEQANIAPYQQESPVSTGLGEITGQTIGTLPIGGWLGALAARIPFVATLAPAITSGGFKTGTAYETAQAVQAAAKAKGIPVPPEVTAQLTKMGWLKTEALKAGGGAVIGGSIAALINPQDITGGAEIGAVVPIVASPIVKKLAQGSGWLYDAVNGRLGEVQAAKIMRQAAGGDLATIKVLNTLAQEGETAGQAAAQVDNSTYQALDALAKGRNTNSWFTRRIIANNAADASTLNQLAGGANATESKAVEKTSRDALNLLTTNMRNAELNAANIAGKKLPIYETDLATATEGATNKVEDVRRFMLSVDRANDWAFNWSPSNLGGGNIRSGMGMPGTSARYTYPGELAVRGEQVATNAAEDSLRLGEIARFKQMQIDSLKAHGLEPLKTDSIISSLETRLKDPDIGLNKNAAGAINRVNQMLADWTNEYGVISGEALYAIRKNGVTGAIMDLNPNATEDARRKLAQSVMIEVKPLIDNAIIKAGGTGWKDYLSTFENGMHGIEQKRMADTLRDLFKNNKQGFIDIVQGNNTKAVEDIFGAGKYDFMKEMGGSAKGSPAITFNKLATNAARDLKIERQALAGGEALQNIFSKNEKIAYPVPNLFNAKIAIAKAGLKEFEGKVNRATMDALEKGMMSGQNANELLSVLPSSERNKLLNLLVNQQNLAPSVGRATTGLFNQ